MQESPRILFEIILVLATTRITPVATTRQLTIRSIVFTVNAVMTVQRSARDEIVCWLLLLVAAMAARLATAGLTAGTVARVAAIAMRTTRAVTVAVSLAIALARRAARSIFLTGDTVTALCL